MKIEDFKRTELYEKVQQEDNDISLDNDDLEAFIKDKEEVYVSTGAAEGENNVELALGIAMKNLEEVWENIKVDRCLLMIEGNLLMLDVGNGVDILREKLEDDDAYVTFGSKYVANKENQVRVDIVVA